MTRKKKHTEEVIEVAQEIATVVASEPVKAEPKVEPPKPVDPPKAKEDVVEVVESSARKRSVRVKATATVRGVYHNMRYSIKEGEVYTFPEDMVEWLKKAGRVI
jgi:transglutaminase-like putative cysteine protease